MSSRYHRSYVHAEISPENVTRNLLKDFMNAYDMTDFVAARPDSTGPVVCYGVRANNAKFNLRKGAKSVEKKLHLPPGSINMIQISPSSKMPDHFFHQLDPDRIEEQLFFSAGKYAKASAIKAHIDTALKQNKNRAVLSRVTQKGIVNAVKEGVIRPGEMTSFEKYQAKVKEEEERNARLAKDVKAGWCIPFVCHLTNKKYVIKSQKMEEEAPEGGEVQDTFIDSDGEECLAGFVHDATFVKKKHYYFYSTKGGYGKTTFMQRMLTRINAAIIADPKNLAGISEDAQFLIVDEYGLNRKFTMDDLKGLTSGNASTSFSGNKKVYGAAYKPRKDAQLIIFSNRHLFDVMGTYNPKKRTRKLSVEEADLLRQRFFIHRLDETKRETEVTDAMKHIGKEDDDDDMFERDPWPSFWFTLGASCQSEQCRLVMDRREALIQHVKDTPELNCLESLEEGVRALGISYGLGVLLNNPESLLSKLFSMLHDRRAMARLYKDVITQEIDDMMETDGEDESTSQWFHEKKEKLSSVM